MSGVSVWEPSYVVHFCYDGKMGCCFITNRVAKTMDEAWEWARNECRRQKAIGYPRISSICVQYVTDVKGGAWEETDEDRDYRPREERECTHCLTKKDTTSFLQWFRKIFAKLFGKT